MPAVLLEERRLCCTGVEFVFTQLVWAASYQNSSPGAALQCIEFQKKKKKKNSLWLIALHKSIKFKPKDERFKLLSIVFIFNYLFLLLLNRFSWPYIGIALSLFCYLFPSFSLSLGFTCCNIKCIR